MAVSSSPSDDLLAHNAGDEPRGNESPYPPDLPGSLAFTNQVVAKMMRLWNYKEGSGLGARGQGIIAAIQPAVQRPNPNAGIGHRKKPYDNGLCAPPRSTESEWEERSRAMEREKECCEKTLALLRDKITLEGDDSAETADALAAVIRSKEVFQRGQRRRVGMWKSALPSSTSRYIIERMVVPAITADLQSWLPSWDAECYHWLRPWIPLIGHLPENLYDAVEAKISGGGDYETISPWKEYLSPVQWDIFAERHILPMLTRMVRELRITPPKQIDGSFRAVMTWAPLVRPGAVARILEDGCFFDKWEDALRHWLRSMKPSLGEALAWCTGWKNLLTPELLADERVLARLEAGVGMVSSEARDLDSLVCSN